MKLEKLILKNFRGYHGEHSIDINSLTALVGRNDVGKTTILDALGVFFEHKLCKYMLPINVSIAWKMKTCQLDVSFQELIYL
ncbi:AAA family ATPase [Pectobacterium versatile]|uniref:AAA family ATPase n=2 Tax=Pectobacterium versatile TaxID=2488639 RepID=A0A7T0HGK0_9GAMM|nr:AAA family ATPase [Pectobacterium versatile]